MLFLMMFGAALWNLGYGLEISFEDLPGKIFWAKFQYLGICTIPLAMFAFSVRYTDHMKRAPKFAPGMSRRMMFPVRSAVWVLLAVPPVVTFGLAVTNEMHHLIWASVSLDPSGAVYPLKLEHGRWFWVYWIYSQALIIAGSGLLLSMLVRSSSLFRRQGMVLLLGLLAPWLSNVVYVLKLDPGYGLDLTPIAFSMTGLALVWGLLRFKFLDVVPIGRSAIIDKMGDGMIVLDHRDRVVDLNPSARPLLRFAPSKVIGRPADQVVSGWGSMGEGEYTEAGAREVQVELQGCHYLLTFWTLRDRGERYAGRLITSRDITSARRAALALKESEERYRSLVDLSPDAAVVHSDGVLAYINPTGMRLLGASSPGEVIGKPALGFVHPDYKEAAAERIRKGYGGDTHQDVFTEKLVRLDGRTIDVEAASAPISYGGKPAVQLVLRDVTERKVFEAELERRAFHDSLTGLPNRLLFLNRLERALAHAGRRPGAVAVLFLDLNGFKLVNDSMGHECGDQLLETAARCLRSCVRPGDTVARMGGDEFTILLEDVSGLDEAIQIAERISNKLCEPQVIAGREIVLTTSIGIALSASVTDRPDDLLRYADIAMYRAKKWSKARYEVFEPAMNSEPAERLSLNRDISLAAERNEFRVFYQPVVRLDTGEMTGLEALLRWEHPERGLLRPSEFIAAAEETGLIMPIGRWVLEQVCRQSGEWHEEHPHLPRLPIHVNVSVRQLRHLGFTGEVSGLLERTGMDPACLGLEIREVARLIEEDAGSGAATLKELKELGVKLILDDFGNGYSSLSYLKRLPIDTIKIDRIFTESLDLTPEDNVLISTLIDLAKALGKEVVAKGVETAGQLAKLRELECEQAQGRYLREPSSGEEASILLAERSAGVGAAGRQHV